MRLATIRTGATTAAARVDGDTAVVLDAPDVGEVLRRRFEGGVVAETGDRAARSELDLAPVVPRPRKIFCVGLNYRDHILEMGRELPAHPTLFAKFDQTLTGPFDDLRLPAESTSVDWEAELVVVVGRRARHVGEEAAREAIAGYTVANDISMRDWQNRTPEWLQGKAFEASTPLGPEMVTADELDAGDLAIQCEVNGTVMQSARTSALVFGPAALVAYISQIITLEPGDLILTGTTGGVGHARKPPVYLAPGDEVRTTIEGIGTLINRCR